MLGGQAETLVVVEHLGWRSTTGCHDWSYVLPPLILLWVPHPVGRPVVLTEQVLQLRGQGHVGGVGHGQHEEGGLPRGWTGGRRLSLCSSFRVCWGGGCRALLAGSSSLCGTRWLLPPLVSRQSWRTRPGCPAWESTPWSGAGPGPGRWSHPSPSLSKNIVEGRLSCQSSSPISE